MTEHRHEKRWEHCQAPGSLEWRAALEPFTLYSIILYQIREESGGNQQ